MGRNSLFSLTPLGRRLFSGAEWEQGSSSWVSQGGFHGQPDRQEQANLKKLTCSRKTWAARVLLAREFGNSPGNFPVGLLYVTSSIFLKK